MKKEEIELFKKWSLSSTSFVKDGIVNYNSYKNQRYKVLYILKETNGFVKGDLREFLRKGGNAKTWNNIALWQYGIQNLDLSHEWQHLLKIQSAKEFRKDQLNTLVAVNLKKEFGKGEANPKYIWDYAKNNKTFLKQQLAIYSPNIIICCGYPIANIIKSYSLIEEFNNWNLSSYGIEYFITSNKIILINHTHPNNRTKSNFLYYPLILTVKEVVLKIEKSENKM